MNKIQQQIRQIRIEKLKGDIISRTCFLNWTREWTNLYEKEKERDLNNRLKDFVRPILEEAQKQLIEAVIEEVEEMKIEDAMIESGVIIGYNKALTDLNALLEESIK